MSFEMEMPESMDTGGAFLEERGTYHFAVLAIDEQPMSKSGQLLNGFRVEAEVLGGPQAKKQVELMFFNPKTTDKNNGEFAKKKQARFAAATCILPEFKPGQKTVVDLQKAVARQFIATVDYDNREGSEGQKKFLQLNFADLWHVDDPSAAKCEFNQQALNLIPKSLRRSPESFKKPGEGGNGNGNGSAAKSNGSANGSSGGNASGGTPASSVDLDNL